jgi:hypothetical protein
MIMPSGSIEAATIPASSSFQGDAGTSAANIRITGPVQVIIGLVSAGVAHAGSQ